MESGDPTASGTDTQDQAADDRESSIADKSESEPISIQRDNSSSIASSPASPAITESKKISDKVKVLLKPVGDAPILKQKIWTVDPDKPVSSIIQFTKQYLRLEREQNLFFFVNQAFAPSPDQLIRNLYECFGSDGKLILHYSTTVAWG